MGEDMKKRTLIILTLLAVILSLSAIIPVFARGDGSVVNDADEARKQLIKGLTFLKDSFGMTLSDPIDLYLVTGQELDSLYGGPYRGNESGLYNYEDGRHKLYILVDLEKDEFVGLVNHELTHGWQAENCSSQCLVIKEGFAIWIEYKTFRWLGAHYYANNINAYIADPIYGVGYRFVQRLEDKYGEKKLPEIIKKYIDYPEDEERK